MKGGGRGGGRGGVFQTSMSDAEEYYVKAGEKS
jgi:hypothetical protein